MSQTPDIVERLRSTYAEPVVLGDGIIAPKRKSACAVTQVYRNPDGPAAADLIEALRSEVTDLQATIAAWNTRQPPAPQDDLAAVKLHVERYDVPEGPRRRYTVCQLETTYRLAQAPVIAERDAALAKLEIAQGLIDCACGYDEASDLCLGHARILANREAGLKAKLAAAEAREGVQECLNVSAYRAGMKAGWNLCDAGDNEGYQRAMEGTDHIAELRRIRAALATEKKP